jgi:hypothetical protein
LNGFSVESIILQSIRKRAASADLVRTYERLVQAGSILRGTTGSSMPTGRSEAGDAIPLEVLTAKIDQLRLKKHTTTAESNSEH